MRRLIPAAEMELTTLDRLEGDFDLLINATPGRDVSQHGGDAGGEGRTLPRGRGIRRGV